MKQRMAFSVLEDREAEQSQKNKLKKLFFSLISLGDIWVRRCDCFRSPHGYLKYLHVHISSFFH